MKAVGIKVLKNNLSMYLDVVREGEIVYVTDRDDIIAEIHKPVSAPTSMVSRWEGFLNEAERKGSIIRAKREKSNLAEALLRLSPAPGSPDWKSILDESRVSSIFLKAECVVNLRRNASRLKKGASK